MLAFIEAKRRALTGQAGGSGAGFSQEGQSEKRDSEGEPMRADGLQKPRAAGRRNWPEAVPRKMNGRKRMAVEISENRDQG